MTNCIICFLCGDLHLFPNSYKNKKSQQFLVPKRIAEIMCDL